MSAAAAPRMIWFRMNCSIYRNPKILRLLAGEHGLEAFTTWSFGIGYSGENGLGGLVPEEALPLLQATQGGVKALEDGGFWERCPQGWIIHDWDHFQTGAPVDPEPADANAAELAAIEAAEKAKKSARGRKAALSRWHPELVE